MAKEPKKSKLTSIRVFEAIALKALLDNFQSTGISMNMSQWVSLSKNIRSLGDVVSSSEDFIKSLRAKYGTKTVIAGKDQFSVTPDNPKMKDFQLEAQESLDSVVDVELYKFTVDEFENENVKSVKDINLFFKYLIDEGA
jgi:hypothetical protein